jgi:hypothetical protein
MKMKTEAEAFRLMEEIMEVIWVFQGLQFIGKKVGTEIHIYPPWNVAK